MNVAVAEFRGAPVRWCAEYSGSAAGVLGRVLSSFGLLSVWLGLLFVSSEQLMGAGGQRTPLERLLRAQFFKEPAGMVQNCEMNLARAARGSKKPACVCWRNCAG